MFQLPPPPRFNLPPPPMPPTDLIDVKIVSQLTCSSFRQHAQETTMNVHLILFASAIVIVAILLLILTLIWLLLSSRKRKQQSCENLKSPQAIQAIDSINDWSTCSSRSYETVSFDHTGIYLESVDTSATTCSTDVTGEVCTECCQHYSYQPQPTPYYHVINIPDLIPN
ncbi:hypothetical protein I4U23_009475 [Adineta vaga]|nr:hypothetical protein I4U23_009475 [Adineta vaga]